jgi:predicted GNAT family N-acyltransferase
MLAQALAIRHLVFVVEQNVPAELETDAYDDAALHLLAAYDKTPVGTARLVLSGPNRAKVGRVAVLADYRGRGWGVRMMKFFEDHARSQHVRELYLDAQLQVIPFYGALGYVAEGPEFLDCGIMHRRMSLVVPQL